MRTDSSQKMVFNNLRYLTNSIIYPLCCKSSTLSLKNYLKDKRFLGCVLKRVTPVAGYKMNFFVAKTKILRFKGEMVLRVKNGFKNREIMGKGQKS